MENRIILSQEQLKEIQKIELEMLQEIERICKKNDIIYSIIGGTLLGAIRHGGFIPWDDDADVVMLRSEYDKFVEACRRDLDTDRFYFQDMHLTRGYRWGYGKLRKKNTLFLRHGQEHMPYEQGIFVDIFPCDNVPDGKVSRQIHKMQSFFLRKLMWSEVGKCTEKNCFIRCVYEVMAKIPVEWNVRQIDMLSGKWKHKDTKLVRTLLWPTPKNKYGFPREWYEKTVPVKFEGIELHMMCDYDKYLPYKFGKDYMQLPPEDKRKVHPVSQLKL